MTFKFVIIVIAKEFSLYDNQQHQCMIIAFILHVCIHYWSVNKFRFASHFSNTYYSYISPALKRPIFSVTRSSRLWSRNAASGQFQSRFNFFFFYSISSSRIIQRSCVVRDKNCIIIIFLLIKSIKLRQTVSVTSACFFIRFYFYDRKLQV